MSLTLHTILNTKSLTCNLQVMVVALVTSFAEIGSAYSLVPIITFCIVGNVIPFVCKCGLF